MNASRLRKRQAKTKSHFAGAKLLVAIISAAALLVLFVPAAQAAFGIKQFSLTATNADGSIDFQAGSHPYAYTFDLDLNTLPEEVEGSFADGVLRNLVVALPPGLVGNPKTTPSCKGILLESAATYCPGSTQIGVAHITFSRGLVTTNPVFNLVPGKGVPGAQGFSVIGFNSFQEASVRSGSDYGLNIADITIPKLGIEGIEETIWGVPADPSHDSERECLSADFSHYIGCPAGSPMVPYLTLPTSCNGPLASSVTVGSLEEPENPQSETVESLNESDEPTGLDGCNALEFQPEISSKATTNLADSPSGLDFKIHQPQNEDPEGLSTAHLKDVTVTLPEGMTLNPSAANGLAACTNAEIGYAPTDGQIHFSEAPNHCPPAAKLGSMEVTTPLLAEKLPGAIYLAKPYENPFGNLTAIYLAIESPQRGIVAKLAGKVTPDPITGQLTASFTENPQLPLEDIETHFFNGPKAALKTPLACGTYTTTSTLTPWSTPEGQDAHPSDSFQTQVAAGGSGACPLAESQAPNKPTFSAGTIAPQAGAYSPFVLRVTRPDGSQRIKNIDVALPEGLTGKLAGIPYCPESAIAQAISREVPNQGALEQQHPSCPAASEVGTVTVGAGAGVTPYYATGHAYLAGPYKGAPLSFVFITPAVAGPFDLGAVVVRTAAYVDPETAKIHAVSDPLPSIIQGVPLDIRSITANLGRPDFTLNPTSCDPTQILGSTTSTLGMVASLSNPFQVGGCKALKFSPKLSLSLKGGTKRGRFPALKAVLTYPQGSSYANTASAQVTLPHGEFIEQLHFKTICTRVQFAANACPSRSIYGRARAFTPLLDKPVEGPVYLRSSSHKLPDLVASLNGQVDVVLAGRIDTGSNGGLRSTFEATPDAPVSKFVLEMQGGKKGLLVNSENICRKEQRAIVDLVAQNGKVSSTTPLVKSDCSGHGARKAAKGKKGHGGKR